MPTEHFKSNAAYRRWNAYRHIHGIPAPHLKKVVVAGKEHKVKHSALSEKPMAKESAGHDYMRTEIEHHRDEDGKMTGHTVKHYPMPKATKSGAFMERGEPATHVFGAHEGKQMLSHLKEHLGIGAAPSPKSEEAEVAPAAHEPQSETMEEEEEGE